MVGMGANVLKNVDEGAVVAGNPAKPLVRWKYIGIVRINTYLIYRLNETEVITITEIINEIAGENKWDTR